jgi:UDP-N-acetyl-D-mannosaminuronic acid dehydrogenase
MSGFASSAAPRPRHIAVVGCGVIGLPTALLLARAGHQVTGVDIDPRVVDAINSWNLPLSGEPELFEVAAEQGTRERLCGSLTMPPAEVYMIAAPTPLDERKKVCDMRAVDSAVRNVIPTLSEGSLLILESTVPPLTTKDYVAPLLREAGWEPGVNCHLAFCPERVLPGTAYTELINNDRIIGGYSERCAELAEEIYRSFVTGELIRTDATTAELCKLSENAYRDVCIAFANEIGLVAEGLGVDRHELISLANRHPRVEILRPGIGVGGHCLPLDPYFVAEVDPFHTRMILTARKVNDEMPRHTVRRIKQSISGIAEPKILGFGLTYKPDTPDMRESPATKVWQLLEQEGQSARIYDPEIAEYAYDDFNSLLQDANCIVVLVAHKKVLADIERNKALLDSRGIPVFNFG